MFREVVIVILDFNVKSNFSFTVYFPREIVIKKIYLLYDFIKRNNIVFVICISGPISIALFALKNLKFSEGKVKYCVIIAKCLV